MYKLLSNKIAVAFRSDPPVTEGGLIVPDAAKERSDQGLVIAVGPDCKYVAVGDYVLFSGYSGDAIRIDDEVFLVMPEECVVCMLQPENVEVPGLYFKGVDGTYFTATFEMATQIMMDALSRKWPEIHLGKMFKDKRSIRPTREDYETGNFSHVRE